MAINPAVLSALVQPVKSVSDYEDMYAERDARQQRNALLQMQMKQAQQGMQQQEAVKNAFAQYGASPQAVNALMSAGAYPEGMKLQEQLRAQAQEAMRRDALRALQPTQAIDANRVSGVTGPRPEALSVVGQKRPFDPAAMLQHFSPEEVAKMQALVDPRVEVKDYKEVRMPDGSVQLVGFGKDGKVVQTGQVPFVKPEVRDFGGYVGGVDLVSGKVQRYGDKTMSAAERDSSARGWAGIQQQKVANDLQKQAQRTQLVETPNGPMLVDRGTGQASPVIMGGQAVKGESAMKKESGAKSVLGVLEDVEKTINRATGSYAGTLVDEGARVAGVATQGAQAIARLRVLEGQLMMAQPRMEGPQSNLDVALYKQMAGQIGDPTVPAATKRAAVDEIRRLQSKYAGSQAEPAQGGAKAPAAQQGGLSPQEQAELDALRKRFGKGQ